MGSIPYVGKCFPTVEAFLDYLDDIKFGAWRPRFVTVHHTGGPDLATWRAWQTRKVPVTDEQWLKNLANYYGSAAYDSKGRKIKDAWSSGPQFFFTPKNYCVLSPPDRRGVHAASFNAMSWGVEMVGNFDSEKLDGELRKRYVDGLAALHIATGLQMLPFEKKVRGLHFHRDDPQTSKTCPGTSIIKAPLIAEILEAIARMTGGEAPPERIVEAPPAKVQRTGTVTGIAVGDTLNVRAAASGKAPVVSKLKNGSKVTILGEAKNDATAWLRVDVPGDDDGWVAARFIAG